MIAELLKSKEPQGFFKTACLLLIARGSSFLLKFLAKSVFPAKEAPASSHMLVSQAEPKIGRAFEIEGTSGFLQNSVFTAKEPPARSHTLVSWAEPIIARGSSFLLKFLCNTACFLQRKLLPAVSRAKPMIAELLKSKEPQGFFKTACLLRRNLLPVVICLSHGLSQSLLVVQLSLQVSCKKACFLRRNSCE